MGDYHCHVAIVDSWLAHYPSPTDIEIQSCLCDFWSLEPPVIIDGYQITEISASSQFQIIQPNLFGDLFIVSALQTRKPFVSLRAQQNAMKQIGSAYAMWHLGAHARLGDMTLPVSHAQFVNQVVAELPNMKTALGGRADINFVKNTAYVSDDDDFLS